jgi:hypothetical protein
VKHLLMNAEPLTIAQNPAALTASSDRTAGRPTHDTARYPPARLASIRRVRFEHDPYA